jgi:mono/diheme cytochrome c family protein
MKRHVKAGLAGITLLAACAAHVPALADNAQRALGEELAARQCAGCHGTHTAKGVTIQGVYVPSFSEVANRPNQTPERLQALITMPAHPMSTPALGDRELRQLAEFIFSLRAP